MKVRGLIYIILLLIFNSAPVFSQGGDSDYQYALIEAVKQKNLGNLPGAIELYKMVIAENDSVAVAHYELGTLLAVTGNDSVALIHLRKAYELDQANEWYYEALVDVLLVREDFSAAEKLVKSKINLHKDKVSHQYKLANVYFLQGKERKAIKILNKVERKYGISDRIVLLKANIYEKAGNYRKAEEEVNVLIHMFPETVQYYVVAAELSMKAKKKDRAMEYYRQVFELDSMNIYALTNLTDYYREKEEFGKSFYYLARSFQSDEIEYGKKMTILSYYLSDEYFFNNYQKDMELLIRSMLTKYPDKREIGIFASDFYIQQRKFHQALEAVYPLLNEKESNYLLWRQAIQLANATNENERLLKITTMAGKLFPDSIQIIYYRGIAEFEQGDYLSASKTFSRDLFAESGNEAIINQATILLAESYNNLKRFPEADSLFRLVLEKQPDNTVVLNNFAYYLSQRGESLEEARSMSYRTIQKEGENSVYLDTYAWILFKQGKFTEAENYIQKALTKGGDQDPDVNEHAGDIHKALGNYELAKDFYEKAIILGGNEDLLSEKLEELNVIQ